MRAPGGDVHSLSLGGTAFDLQGQAEFGALPIEIHTLHELPDSKGRPHRIPFVLGYELRQGDQVLASVDKLGRGRVYLSHDLPPELRTPVAMTATVLLFFGEG